MTEIEKNINTAVAIIFGWQHFKDDLWISPDMKDGFDEKDCKPLPNFINDKINMCQGLDNLPLDRYYVYLNKLADFLHLVPVEFESYDDSLRNAHPMVKALAVLETGKIK